MYCNYILNLIYGVCAIMTFYIIPMTGLKLNILLFDIDKFIR